MNNVKCKLCEWRGGEADLQTHWKTAHPGEWKGVRRGLRELDWKVEQAMLEVDELSEDFIRRYAHRRVL